jgi:hypothetical protein
VLDVVFDTEYIFKTYVESEKTEAESRGEIRGERKGEIKGERKGEIKGAINATIRMCKEFNVSVADTVKKIIDEFGLTENEAERKVKEYWK